MFNLLRYLKKGYHVADLGHIRRIRALHIGEGTEGELLIEKVVTGGKAYEHVSIDIAAKTVAIARIVGGTDTYLDVEVTIYENEGYEITASVASC